MRAGIHNLPDELLSMIFACSLQEKSDLKPYCAPLLLARVCSRWRSVALETPDLWTKISLHKEDLNSKGLIDLLEMWLYLSKEKLLDVDLDVHWLDMSTWDVPSPTLPFCQDLASVLSHHCHRFRTLTGSFHESIAGVLRFSNMTSLEELDLLDVSQELETSYFDLSIQLPHLHTIVLRKMFLGDQIQTLCCQKQLTRLETDWLKLNDVCVLLAALPKLEVVSLSLAHTTDDQEQGDLTVTRLHLPSLRRVHVKCHRLNPSSLLAHLTTPNLDELHLENFSHPTKFWISLRAFILAGGGNHLQKLKLHVSDGPFNRLHANTLLVDILRGTPELKHLSCSGSFFNTEILQALSWNGHTPERTLIPCLETLEIWLCKEFAVTQLIAG